MRSIQTYGLLELIHDKYKYKVYNKWIYRIQNYMYHQPSTVTSNYNSYTDAIYCYSS